MAIDFPNSPSVNDQFTSGLQTWKWDGTSWNIVGTAGPSGDWSTAQVINSQSSNYTLLTSDVGKLVTMTGSSAANFTIDTSLALSAGQRIDVIQTGSGQITFVASSTTLNGTPGLKTRAQYSSATLICLSSNTYVVVGDLSA